MDQSNDKKVSCLNTNMNRVVSYTEEYKDSFANWIASAWDSIRDLVGSQSIFRIRL